MLPDFLRHLSGPLRTAGRQLRMLHAYQPTQPLACLLMASASQGTAEALAIVQHDTWAGALCL